MECTAAGWSSPPNGASKTQSLPLNFECVWYNLWSCSSGQWIEPRSVPSFSPPSPSFPLISGVLPPALPLSTLLPPASSWHLTWLGRHHLECIIVLVSHHPSPLATRKHDREVDELHLLCWTKIWAYSAFAPDMSKPVPFPTLLEYVWMCRHAVSSMRIVLRHAPGDSPSSTQHWSTSTEIDLSKIRVTEKQKGTENNLVANWNNQSKAILKRCTIFNRVNITVWHEKKFLH